MSHARPNTTKWILSLGGISLLYFVFTHFPTEGRYVPSGVEFVQSRMRDVHQALGLYLADDGGVYPGVTDQQTFRTLMTAYLPYNVEFPELSDYRANITFNTRLANVNLSIFDQPTDSVIDLWSLLSPSKSDPISYGVASFAHGSTSAAPIKEWNATYADDLDRNYPRVSETFLPSSP